MSILCTIHSPSSDLFMVFDRCILLSVGYTLYNGPVGNVDSYFRALGAPLPDYTNAADFLIRIATDPALVKLHYSVARLAKECKDSYVNHVKNIK